MVQRNVIMAGEAQWSLLMCFVNLLLVIVATLTCNAAEPKTLKTFVYIADLEQKDLYLPARCQTTWHEFQRIARVVARWDSRRV